MKLHNPFSGKKRWLVAIVIVMISVGGLGFGMWQNGAMPGTLTATPTARVKTAQIERGDVAAEITGTGTLVATNTMDLSFESDGEIASINVQPGDRVSKGTVLAALEDIESLEVAVKNKQQALNDAKEALAKLTTNAGRKLAEALAERAEAQEAYADAQAHLYKKGEARCDADVTLGYYFTYFTAQHWVDVWDGQLTDPESGYGRNYILQNLRPYEIERDKAYNNWTYCQGYTQEEIDLSEANLQVAKANYEYAAGVYAELQANGGVDPLEVKVAEADVRNAENQLTQAKIELVGATIVAPIDGTIIEVNATVGDVIADEEDDTKDTSSASGATAMEEMIMEALMGNNSDDSQSTGNASNVTTIISIANIDQPVLEVNMDESDYLNFGVGCPAEVVFDMLPGKTFSGVVTQVSPTLVSVDSVDMVQGLVEFNENVKAKNRNVAIGLNASVDVTCHEAKNAILAPSEAIVRPDEGSAYVYVLTPVGAYEKREIELGVSTSLYAEVLSGLSEGEQVVLNPAEIE